jgi:hypothetical protein
MQPKVALHLDLLLTPLRAINDTLTKAVHALYANRDSDSGATGADVPTNTILQSLGLAQQVSPEDGARIKCVDPTDAQSEDDSMSEPSPTERDTATNFEPLSRMSSSEKLTSTTLSVSSSEQCEGGGPTTSEPSSFGIQSSWEFVPTNSGLNEYNTGNPLLLFDHHFQQKSKSIYPPNPIDANLVMNNDFDLYLGLMAEGIPGNEARDEFGFDPPMWLTETNTMDWVPSGVCGSDAKTNKCNNFQALSAIPPMLTTAVESKTPASITAYSLSPTTPKDGIHPSPPASSPSAQPRPLPSPQRRPGRPRHDPPGSDRSLGGDAEQKRRSSLEKNRLAAAKCREKRKAEVDALKDASVASKAENNLLRQQTTKLREELLDLRQELLTHVFRNGCCGKEEFSVAMDTKAVK